MCPVFSPEAMRCCRTESPTSVACRGAITDRIASGEEGGRGVPSTDKTILPLAEMARDRQFLESRLRGNNTAGIHFGVARKCKESIHICLCLVPLKSFVHPIHVALNKMQQSRENISGMRLFHKRSRSET